MRCKDGERWFRELRDLRLIVQGRGYSRFLQNPWVNPFDNLIRGFLNNPPFDEQQKEMIIQKWTVP